MLGSIYNDLNQRMIKQLNIKHTDTSLPYNQASKHKYKQNEKEHSRKNEPIHSLIVTRVKLSYSLRRRRK